MGRWFRQPLHATARGVWKLLTAGVGPLAVLAVLAALDHWVQGPAPFAGVLIGMAVLAWLLALAWWGRGGAKALPPTLLATLRSTTEGALGVVLVFLLVAPLTLLLPEPWIIQLTRDDRATDLLTMLMLGVGLVVAARAWTVASRQQARAAEAERDAALVRAELAERERALVQAELQVLRAQVEPHFLWNTLAHVEYLTRHEPDRAGAMLSHLITFLRSSLPMGRRSHSTLAQEFASVQAYLHLMQYRMGDRLRFELALPADAGDQPCPPLMLQTLVENAIKHGLEPLIGPAWVKVTAGFVGPTADFVYVEVEDNGVGLSPAPGTRGTGLGLRQVRERLQALYGPKARLSVNSREGGGVRARIEWPADGQPPMAT